MSEVRGEPARAGWIRPTPEYSLPLFEFLKAREYRCVALSERLKRWADLDASRIRFRALEGNKPWIHRGGVLPSVACPERDPETIDGAALLQPDGRGLCILPETEDGLRGFVALAGASRPLSSLIGPAEALDKVAMMLEVKPLEAKKYLLMLLQTSESPGSPPERGGFGANPSALKGKLEIRRATIRDFARLCSMHEAYEREEMGSREPLFAASLPERILGILRKQIAVVAMLDGTIVGKANTNARGVGVDQLGGVYVSPEARRGGIGSMMVESLVSYLSSLGRGVCLYVRPENEAARRLYIKLGFVGAGSYAAYRFR